MQVLQTWSDLLQFHVFFNEFGIAAVVGFPA
jgi:hypothetical protein